MKLIVAIIRPEKLEAVQNALNERDVYLMTVSDIRGCGRQRGFTEVYRGTEFQVRLLPKLKLEIAVNDAFVEATVEAIVHSARTGDTGQIGDGKIFVLPLDDAVHSHGRARRPGHRAVSNGSGDGKDGIAESEACVETRLRRDATASGRDCVGTPAAPRLMFRDSQLPSCHMHICFDCDSSPIFCHRSIRS